MMSEWKDLLSKPPETLTDREAGRLALGLQGLSRWLLKPEVLEKAAAYLADDPIWTEMLKPWRERPALPQDAGSCWVVTVLMNAEKYPALREAAVLPLRWQRRPADQPSGAHDPRLPEGLRQIADRVLQQVAEEEPSVKEANWRLVPAIEQFPPGPAQELLVGSYESAFASLAAGLFLATWEGKPDPTVWATGAWADGGIQPIEGLPQKAALAIEWGAKVLFVPEQQQKELEKNGDFHAVAHGLHLLPLRAGTRKLRESLREYLDQLEVPPGPEASRKQRSAYFLRIPDDAKARQYYREYILPEVREAWRPAIHQQVPRFREEAPLLVSIVSKGFDLQALTVGVLQPQQCLLLYNEEMATEIPMVEETIGEDCALKKHRFTGQTREELLQEFQNAIRDFLHRMSGDRLVVDLTPGQRIMNLALYDAMPTGSFALVCQAEMDKNTRRPKPFTEKFELWQVNR